MVPPLIVMAFCHLVLHWQMPSSLFFLPVLFLSSVWPHPLSCSELLPYHNGNKCVSHSPACSHCTQAGCIMSKALFSDCHAWVLLGALRHGSSSLPSQHGFSSPPCQHRHYCLSPLFPFLVILLFRSTGAHLAHCPYPATTTTYCQHQWHGRCRWVHASAWSLCFMSQF